LVPPLALSGVRREPEVAGVLEGRAEFPGLDCVLMTLLGILSLHDALEQLAAFPSSGEAGPRAAWLDLL
jgi:hypothetical protein